ncbi:MAG TPA: phosphohistidine phosphatase SixA [Candidatus Baltobacteraceae bacterium]|jgi:phosphohistidine phosphatase|nr:phosphohistidine phosphatase SixA [Candidatus Baltobacteraceae bacterium]
MKIYFVRHGVAVDREEFQGEDRDRPLTREGKDRMAQEAKALGRLRIKPDAIITSPLVRAKQTAEIVAKELDLRDRLVEDEGAGLEFDAGKLGALLEKYADSATVMIVGHEPSMSQTIGRVIGGANIDLKKGGIACVEMQHALDTAAMLLWLLPPKVLL